MTSAAIAKARKEAAIKDRPFDKRPPRPERAPTKCYVCGAEMASRGMPGGRAQGGVCGRCWSDAQRQRDEVKRSRAAAERARLERAKS